jgi:hypothetical protein
MSKIRENRIYYPTNSIIFTVPIFTKVALAERHQVQMFSAEFRLNRSLNLEIMGRNPFTPLSEVCVMPLIFAEVSFP